MDTRNSGSTPWWMREHEGPTPDERRVLQRVEACFAEEAAGLTEWADPHYDPSEPGHRRDSTDEEYSRCLEPQKYTIVLARADAWVTVLTELGWAEVSTASGELDGPGRLIEWALPPWSHQSQGSLRVLRPVDEGAVPLTLWAVDAAEDSAAHISVCAGDPAVLLDQIPDCGCDACDSGSEDLLKSIDETVLSVIGGSLVVDLDTDWLSIRHGRGARAGGPHAEMKRPASFRAGPWTDSWTPRPVSDAMDPPRSTRGVRLPRLASRFVPLPRRYATYRVAPSKSPLRRRKRG